MVKCVRKADSMLHPARLVTAEELERMSDDDYRYELVEGRLIRMSPVGGLHGVVTGRLLVRLGQYVQAHDLGLVGPEIGFALASNPDTVRAPDVAFVRRDRIPGGKPPRGFWVGPPDFAVEVLSPDDGPAQVADKVAEYLASGVQLVWVVDPDERMVTVHRPQTDAVVFREGDELDAAGVVPGFTCSVRDILVI
jgi:Uma2 family endonuclease